MTSPFQTYPTYLRNKFSISSSIESHSETNQQKIASCLVEDAVDEILETIEQAVQKNDHFSLSLKRRRGTRAQLHSYKSNRLSGSNRALIKSYRFTTQEKARAFFDSIIDNLSTKEYLCVYLKTPFKAQCISPNLGRFSIHTSRVGNFKLTVMSKQNHKEI